MRMYTCKQVTQLVLERHERPLSWRERVGLRLHLLICAACTRFAQQMRFLRSVAHRFAARHLEEADKTALPAAAKERIRRTLHGK
jgi:hypothetical protein